MEFSQDMYPYQPTWSNTRINLLQRCPRAFVLRYGLAKLSENHPQGQLLSEAFAIQTPWILMHQIVRQVVLDYVEDYANGTVWSHELIRIRFTKDYGQAILHRNQRIEQFQHYGLEQTLFQKTQPEDHLIEMGVDSCLNLVQNQNLVSLLKSGSIVRLQPTNSIVKQNIRVYCSPDLIHHGRDGTSLIKLHLYGKISSFENVFQASLLQEYGDRNSIVIQFSLSRRKWFVHKYKPNSMQRKQALDIISQDVKQMESAFWSVRKNNDLTKVPLADTYRSCTSCNVRFICPSRHGYEQAKAEQRSLMCQ